MTMRAIIIIVLVCLIGLCDPATAQYQPYGGAFAAVPAPGQPAASSIPTPTTPPTPGVARPPTPQPPGAKPEEQLRIVADPPTNSIIIYGTTQEYQNIKNILKELDIVPRQVLLDVLVAQVELTDLQSLGIEYEIFRRSGVSIFGQTFPSQGALRSGIIPSLAEAATVTQFGRGLSGIAGTSNAIRAFINAVQGDSRVKVLSSPNILATDNRPARIQIGSEEPIPTGSVTSNELTTTSTTIQYRNTGQIVTIIPQVNSQGLVNLQVRVEVSERGADVQIGAASTSATGGSSTNTFPSFTTRDAETTAVVQDGETLVIGGIIADRRARTRSGIPYLMDLPFLGRFFGTTVDDSRRQELIMMISPRVIRNRDESRGATEEFKSRLLLLRNDLERMRQERERSLEKPKSQTRDPSRPAEPEAPPTEPSPPPVNAPARPGAYFSPVLPPAAPGPERPLVESAVGSENVQRVTATQAGLESLLGAIEAAVESSRQDKPFRIADSIAKEPKEGEASAPPVRSPTEPAAVPTKKPATVWVVQVASYVEAKDAELLAKKLRDKGYDVRVVTAEVGGRTWHRVRVGEFGSRREAIELQNSLKSAEKMEQAFIASR